MYTELLYISDLSGRFSAAYTYVFRLGIRTDCIYLYDE